MRTLKPLPRRHPATAFPVHAELQVFGPLSSAIKTSAMVGQKTLLELRRHMRRLPSGSVFLFPGKGGQKPMQAARLARRLGELGRSLGFAVSPHRLRHSCARQMCLDGAGIPTIQARLGHSSPTMTLHYAQLFNQDVLERGRQFSPGDRL